MATPRRVVLRPPRPTVDNDRQRRQDAILRHRARLHKEQQALARWMTRLKRAFHAVEKQQRRVTTLERAIARLEQA